MQFKIKMAVAGFAPAAGHYIEVLLETKGFCSKFTLSGDGITCMEMLKRVNTAGVGADRARHQRQNSGFGVILKRFSIAEYGLA
ncbi:hypothetical protein [Paralysiella testudinis]|uniref:Uncharacterized protein n=1 Tax=Paralysiella testudinis TaxID=2809020 RepID=A0A892ZGQ4_9NEIS|nr:hypothetical protein [Paralysiella testudinis]QRQ81017.1 hypothetical protein JQU52_09775 [Paralysiella testudinis]